MYEAYYGFREKPFNLTPDPKYLFLSARHTEAFAHLEFGRRERGGFIVITGEVGTGKTTLARYFLGHLGDQAATAVVLYPALTAAELLRSILDDLHVPAKGDSLKDLVDTLHQFLLESHGEGRNVVLLIDEAQDLSAEVLEQIRLISNLETDTEKLIQIVLMGQSELHEHLSRRELRQLSQRVTARYHLAPLNREEAEEYVRHRLRVAGGEDKVAFTAGALGAVHRLSSGVPRLINLICDRALLAGYVKGTRELDTRMVRRAAREVRGEAPARRPAFSLAVLSLTLAAALVGVVAFGVASRTPVATPAPATASPVVAKPAATPASLPTPGDLDALLLGLPAEGSLESAATAVGALWGEGPLERTFLRTHFDQLRRLDLPAVLEMFHPSRRNTGYVALLGLSENSAVVGDGAGGRRVLPVAELDRRWTRQALVLWRDVESTDAGRDGVRTRAFARASLARLGYPDPGLGGDLAATVARFQRDTELAADGVIGNQTLMGLYAMGLYQRPRLAKAGRP
jgi:general secretion pathway protein A